MGNTLSFTIPNQNDDETSMLDNKVNTTNDEHVHMADLADNVKVNIRDNYAIGHRPTVSCVFRLDQEDNSTSDTGRCQTCYVFIVIIVIIGCFLFVVMVYGCLHFISEKIKPKT